MFQSEHDFQWGCTPHDTLGQDACREGTPSCRPQKCVPGRKQEEHMTDKPPGHWAAGQQWFCR